MASDVMSLFGLDPAVIQQQRVQKGVDQASAMSADYAIGAAGGGMMGAGINTAFGLQTPEMAQAGRVQDSIVGADLSTPEGLRAAASKLMQAGAYAQAMDLYQQASNMVSAEPSPVAAKADTLGSEGLYIDPEENIFQGAYFNKILSVEDGKGGWKPAPLNSKKYSPPKTESQASLDSGSTPNTFNRDGALRIIRSKGLIDTGITTDEIPELEAGLMADMMAREVENLTSAAGGRYSPSEAIRIATERAMLGIYNDDSFISSDSLRWRDPANQPAAQPAAGSVPVGYEVITYNGKQYARHATDKTKPIIAL
jgi:hypothetical protein